MANASQSFSDKLAKYIAIIGGTLAICAALGVPTQLGAFGEFRIPGLPSRDVTALSLSQGEGPSRTKVTVTGKGFDAGEIVDIRFDREKIGEATVDGDGAFSVDVRIPSSFDAIRRRPDLRHFRDRAKQRQACEPTLPAAGGRRWPEHGTRYGFRCPSNS